MSSSVISGESVDPWFNQNQSVFSIFVFSTFLQMSSNVDSLFNQTVNVLWDLWGATWIINLLPFFLSNLTIFCPVKSLMLGTAYLSLMATPICDGLIPFLAIVTMSYEILLGVCATHLAHLLLKGVTVELIPFPFPFDCIRPIDYHNIKIIFIILIIFCPNKYLLH